MDQDDYIKMAKWTEGHSSDTKPDEYHTVRTRCHTLPVKPIPLPKPKPKVNRVSSTDGTPPITQRKKLPIPLPRNEGIKPLPSLPTRVQTELPEIDPLPEEPVQPPTVTSKPYDLETFYKTFEFPQIVSVVGGHLGVTEEYSMSEGEELVLFFGKSSEVVVASSERNSEWYYIPLNSSLQFVPCQYSSTSDTSTKGEEYYQQYKTVADLLNRKGELPKVMKASKTYTGKSAQSSVVAGDLIFPQKVLVSFRRKKVLECLNSKNELLKLELNCEGNFSINPADVKMYLAELVHYFKDFPISAMIINEHKGRSKSSSLTTGTVLSLEKPKALQSYICSTDIFGKMNYPLMELPMSMPIEVQCIEYPDFDMKPVYTKIQHTYENFKPSMITKNMFDAQSTSKLTTQQELYDEIQSNDDNTYIYNLEKPSLIYDSIPEKFSCPANVIDQDLYSIPAKKSFSVVDKAPPIPPPRKYSPPTARKENPYHVSDLFPVPPKPSTESEEIIRNNVTSDTVSSLDSNEEATIPTKQFLSLVNKAPPLARPREYSPTTARKEKDILPLPSKPSTESDEIIRSNVTSDTVSFSDGNEEVAIKTSTLLSKDDPSVTVENSSHISSCNPIPSTCGNKIFPRSASTSQMIDAASYVDCTKEENVAYLKTFTLFDMLQLLDNMNLGQYKENFKDEQIDGEMLVHLERTDLVDLGVSKTIHQTRLLKLIDGSVSAKKYEDGVYESLKGKQSSS